MDTQEIGFLKFKNSYIDHLKKKVAPFINMGTFQGFEPGMLSQI